MVKKSLNTVCTLLLVLAACVFPHFAEAQSPTPPQPPTPETKAKVDSIWGNFQFIWGVLPKRFPEIDWSENRRRTNELLLAYYGAALRGDSLQRENTSLKGQVSELIDECDSLSTVLDTTTARNNRNIDLLAQRDREIARLQAENDSLTLALARSKFVADSLAAALNKKRYFPPISLDAAFLTDFGGGSGATGRFTVDNRAFVEGTYFKTGRELYHSDLYAVNMGFYLPKFDTARIRPFFGVGYEVTQYRADVRLDTWVPNPGNSDIQINNRLIGVDREVGFQKVGVFAGIDFTLSPRISVRLQAGIAQHVGGDVVALRNNELVELTNDGAGNGAIQVNWRITDYASLGFVARTMWDDGAQLQRFAGGVNATFTIFGK